MTAPPPGLAFDYRPATRLVCGRGALDRLGGYACELGGREVLLVSDPGLADAGHVAHAEASLRAAGCTVATFLDVGENPTTAHVDAGVAFAREHAVDLIVGLGGGSAMDCAKGINFLLTNGGRMQDYWGVGKARKGMLPMIAVPTTAGTGSESQSFALIADAETHQKMACGDPKAACRLALLDPGLTLSQPRAVTMATGLDALAHAVETAGTRPRNAISLMFSLEAWRKLVHSLPAVLEAPDDIAARARMQLGASLAGAAIENSMLGAAHSCANPLTASFGIVHGIAVAVMLPHVVRWNADHVGEAYMDLCAAAGWKADDAEAAAERLAVGIEERLDQCGVPRALADHGVTADAVPALATGAAAQWTAQFNPRETSEEDFAMLYTAAMNTGSCPKPC